jgi:hypothetical protein
MSFFWNTSRKGGGRRSYTIQGPPLPQDRPVCASVTEDGLGVLLLSDYVRMLWQSRAVALLRTYIYGASHMKITT